MRQEKPASFEAGLLFQKRRLVEDLGDGSCTDGVATFTDGELGLGFEGNGVDELDGELDVVARHDHLDTLRKGDGSGDIGRTEVELRSVVGSEGSVSSALFLLQNVDLALELSVRSDGADLAKDLSTDDLVTIDASEKGTDVVASLGVVEGLAEHFKGGDDALPGREDTDDFDFIVRLDDASLDSTGSNGATTGDGHDIFDGEKEGLLGISLRGRDVLIDGIHELDDALLGLGILVEGLEGRTPDDRDFVSGIAVLAEKLTDIHLDEIDEFRIIDGIALVEEDDDVGDTDLTGKKDVLSGLGHDAVGSSDDEDGSIHLGSAGDHVLDVVGVTRAVDVAVMPGVGFVLDVGSVDGDASGLLFGSGIDLIITHSGGETLLGEGQGDGSGEGGLAVIDVTDGADVDIRLGTVEFLLSHLFFPPNIDS